MLNRLMQWHREVEEEQLAVLENPELVARLPAGPRRYFGSKLAEMTPIERQQMHAFCARYRGWRTYAAIGACMLGLTVLALPLGPMFPKLSLLSRIVFVNAVGLGLLAGFIGAYFNHRRLMRRKTLLILLLSLVGGVLSGSWFAAHAKGISLFAMLAGKWSHLLLGVLAGSTVVILPVLAIAVVRNRQHRQIAEKLALDAERERNARALSESRLRLLHARIEPHFLFNTLGAVQQLAERGSPKAAALTAHLIDFLRASMAQMRNETDTLQQDFALVASYLEVMQARLGERLSFTMDLPAPLAGVAMPGMMLLTLVENAIKHGIEPSLRGGAIHVSAQQLGSSIHVSVRDTGVGLADLPGAGEGLDNVRKRLQLIYPQGASLSVSNAPEGGVLATIVFPLNEKV